MEFVETVCLNSHRSAGTTITIVFRQVKDTAISRKLHVEWRLRFKPMLPINLETEKIHIEFSRFGFIEDAKDWCGSSEIHAPTSFSSGNETYWKPVML